MTTLGVVVTPHGFGHAARASAVVEALARHLPDLRVELWTTVPEWFFADSLRMPFRRHAEALDVGLVQRSSLAEDLPATVAALAALLDDTLEARLDRLAREVRDAGCGALLVDIAPVGVALAERAGVPSILVESFSWDWIYAAYVEEEPALAPFLPRLRGLRADPDLWIQTVPACEPDPRALAVAPVGRAPRQDAAAVRERLGVGDDPRPLVLLTMGGVPWDYAGCARYREASDCLFVIPGGAETPRREGNLLLLPHRSPLYHPDLVAAADLAAGKLGYSTVAEAWRAGSRLAYVPRPVFRESPVLEAFVAAHLPAAPITPEAFATGSWTVDILPALLARPRPAPGIDDGAEEAAVAIAELLRGG